MEKPVRSRRSPATVSALHAGGAREPGRQPDRDVPRPRVKGKASPWFPASSASPFFSSSCSPRARPRRRAPPDRPSPRAPRRRPPPSDPPAYPVTLSDDAGRSVTLDAEPERIVSLAPSNTEIVCALDACDLIVGVTDFDDYPPEVADVDKVVIDGPGRRRGRRRRRAGPRHRRRQRADADRRHRAAHRPRTAGDDALPRVARRDLRRHRARRPGARPRRRGSARWSRTWSRASRRCETAVADLERPRTFYEVGVFEGTIYTAGEGSFIASLIETAGGEPITGDALSTVHRDRGPRRRRSGAHPARRRQLRPDHHRRVGGRPTGLGDDDGRRRRSGRAGRRGHRHHAARAAHRGRPRGPGARHPSGRVRRADRCAPASPPDRSSADPRSPARRSSSAAGGALLLLTLVVGVGLGSVAVAPGRGAARPRPSAARARRHLRRRCQHRDDRDGPAPAAGARARWSSARASPVPARSSRPSCATRWPTRTSSARPPGASLGATLAIALPLVAPGARHRRGKLVARARRRAGCSPSSAGWRPCCSSSASRDRGAGCHRSPCC